MLCYVCFNEKEVLNNTKLKDVSIFNLPLPPPSIPKPDNCEICNNNKKIIWTLHGYMAEVHNEAHYGWYCEDCLYQMYLES
jgi:hypothetical protein